MTGRTQRYARCMFKRVGAPQHLIRLYRVSQRSDHKDIALKFLFLQLFLGVFVCLQMSVYLLVAATSLWIDQLINGTLVNISTHNTVYLVSFTILNLVSFLLDYASYRYSFSPYQFLIPWITMVRVFGSAICLLGIEPYSRDGSPSASSFGVQWSRSYSLERLTSGVGEFSITHKSFAGHGFNGHFSQASLSPRRPFNSPASY